MRVTSIVLIVIVVALLGALGFLGYYAYTHGFHASPQTTNNQPPVQANVSFKIIDGETHNSVTQQFKIFSLNYFVACLDKDILKIKQENFSKFQTEFFDVSLKTFVNDSCYIDHVEQKPVKQGTFSGEFNVLPLNQNQTLVAYLYSDDYYVSAHYFSTETPEIEAVLEPHVLEQYKKTSFIDMKITNESIDNRKQRITLYASAKNQYRDLIYCFQWTFGVDRIDMNLPEIQKPLRLAPHVDKCYSTGQSIFNNQVAFSAVVFYNNVTRADRITIYAIDAERSYNGVDWPTVPEDTQKQDVGAPDFTFTYEIGDQFAPR